MTKDERIEILQRQLDMTNANYNILNKKYIELNLKIKHLLDGIEIIKYREYSDISQLVEENCILKKKNREQDDKIKELQSELILKNNIIWDENDKAVLCGDCYCVNNDVRRLIKENRQLKEEIKQLKFDCAMYKSANYLINDVGIDKAREIL